jgi:hypothetical protein
VSTRQFGSLAATSPTSSFTPAHGSAAILGAFAAATYVDLRVLCRDVLTLDELRRLGELARTEETRPIMVRQGKDLLADAISVPETA